MAYRFCITKQTSTCMAYKCILVLAKVHNSITRFHSISSTETAKLVGRCTYPAMFCQSVSINLYQLLYYLLDVKKEKKIFSA